MVEHHHGQTGGKGSQEPVSTRRRRRGIGGQHQAHTVKGLVLALDGHLPVHPAHDPRARPTHGEPDGRPQKQQLDQEDAPTADAAPLVGGHRDQHQYHGQYD